MHSDDGQQRMFIVRVRITNWLPALLAIVLAFVPDRTQNSFHECVQSDASGGGVGPSRLRLRRERLLQRRPSHLLLVTFALAGSLRPSLIFRYVRLTYRYWN